MREYQLDFSQYGQMLDASAPSSADGPAIYLPGGPPVYEDARKKAEALWRKLGKKMGFDWKTVRPAPDKPAHFFLAEPKQ